MEPGPGGIYAEWKEWETLLRELAPSQRAYDAVYLLPLTAYRAWFILTRDESVSPPRNTVRGGFRELVREVSLWTMLFQRIIDEVGADHLRDALERHVDDARLGFGGFPLYLKETGVLASELDQPYAGFLQHFWDFSAEPDSGAGKGEVSPE
jgi:hypothetical protein